MSDLRRADMLYESEKYAVALPLFQAALRRSEQQPGGASAPTPHILFRLGYCYTMQSEYRVAVRYLLRAAAISNCSFEVRVRASLNAAGAFFNLNENAEADNHIHHSFSMIEAESIAGTTAPTLLKGHRAEHCSFLR